MATGSTISDVMAALAPLLVPSGVVLGFGSPILAHVLKRLETKKNAAPPVSEDAALGMALTGPNSIGNTLRLVLEGMGRVEASTGRSETLLDHLTEAQTAAQRTAERQSDALHEIHVDVLRCKREGDRR